MQDRDCRTGNAWLSLCRASAVWCEAVRGAEPSPGQWGLSDLRILQLLCCHCSRAWAGGCSVLPWPLHLPPGLGLTGHRGTDSSSACLSASAALALPAALGPVPLPGTASLGCHNSAWLSPSCLNPAFPASPLLCALARQQDTELLSRCSPFQLSSQGKEGAWEETPESTAPLQSMSHLCLHRVHWDCHSSHSRGTESRRSVS